MNKYHIFDKGGTGTDDFVGTQQAKSSREAIDKMAVEMGYKNYNDLLAQTDLPDTMYAERD